MLRLTLLLFISVFAISAAAPALPPIDEPALPNAHVVTDKVLSGAQPEGEAGFKSLAKLGVKTIISVDGAKPDVEAAKKRGMRYVHLPIGYDGVSGDEGKAIAKAIAELPGKIYLHCHHGKHRSAAAVAVACVINGTLDAKNAEVVLQTFGTGENYIGLWKAARAAKAVDSNELRNFKVDYVETAQITDLAGLMVAADTNIEHLNQIQKAGWKSPSFHPDLDPPHEALLLQEHLREAARLESSQSRPAKFHAMLSDSAKAAQRLRDALSAATIDQKNANVQMAKVNVSCISCHQAFRD